MTTQPSRTIAANQARRQNTQAKLDQLQETVQAMRREGCRITYPAVAQRSGVSRTFLYQNAEAKALMTTAVAGAGDSCSQALADHAAQLEASWRQRALNAEDALKTADAEIGTQRERIAILLGQIRDLEAEYTAETVQRILTESSELKQRVRELTDDTRTLRERLTAARSNNRFLDRRIAELEAQLLEAQNPQ